MKSKIKLNLFKLKSKQDLEYVYHFFKKSTEKWFDSNQKPKSDFFNTTDCPLCNANLSKEAFKIDGFSYWECLDCKSLYANPTLRNETLDDLYDNGMYQVYQDNLVKKGSRIRKGVLDERKYSQIDNLLGRGVRPLLLDIGCGCGTFLDVCKQHEWHVEGVDVSLEAAQSVLENYQIHTYYGNFNQIKFNKLYDVITLWGVLEHVLDPISVIKKAKGLLNKGGMIVFEVPSADCFIGEYLKKYNFSPTRYIESGRHNIFFSKEIIDRIAESLGGKVELIETNGLDIQTILLEEFNTEITDKILNLQDILNDLLLGDHYRVFMKF